VVSPSSTRRLAGAEQRRDRGAREGAAVVSLRLRDRRGQASEERGQASEKQPLIRNRAICVAVFPWPTVPGSGGVTFVSMMSPPNSGMATIRPASGACTGRDSGVSFRKPRCKFDTTRCNDFSPNKDQLLPSLMERRRVKILMLRNSCRTLFGRVLCPLFDLAQAYLVLRGIPVNGDREFRRAGLWETVSAAADRGVGRATDTAINPAP